MPDSFESPDLPDELRDVASQLRGLRPAAARASQAECMYRAGWQAALAAHAARQAQNVPSWRKSFLGGLLSGSLLSGALTTCLLLGMARPWLPADAERESNNLAQEPVPPALERSEAQVADSQMASARHRQPLSPDRAGPAEDRALPLPGLTDDFTTATFLSPVSRRQWRENLTQASAPYALPRTTAATSDKPVTETLRSAPPNVDSAWFEPS
jgi:hypothetical protein